MLQVYLVFGIFVAPVNVTATASGNATVTSPWPGRGALCVVAGARVPSAPVASGAYTWRTDVGGAYALYSGLTCVTSIFGIGIGILGRGSHVPARMNLKETASEQTNKIVLHAVRGARRATLHRASGSYESTVMLPAIPARD